MEMKGAKPVPVPTHQHAVEVVGSFIQVEVPSDAIEVRHLVVLLGLHPEKRFAQSAWATVFEDLQDDVELEDPLLDGLKRRRGNRVRMGHGPDLLGS